MHEPVEHGRGPEVQRAEQQVLDPGEDEQERFHLAALRGDDEVDGVVREGVLDRDAQGRCGGGRRDQQLSDVVGPRDRRQRVDTSERPTGDSAKKKCMLSGSEPGPMSRGVVHMMNPPLSVAYSDGPEARNQASGAAWYGCRGVSRYAGPPKIDGSIRRPSCEIRSARDNADTGRSSRVVDSSPLSRSPT